MALKYINTCFITRLPNMVLNTVLSLALSVYELVDDVAKAYNGANLLARTATRYVYSPMLDGVVRVGGRHVGGVEWGGGGHGQRAGAASVSPLANSKCWQY